MALAAPRTDRIDVPHVQADVNGSPVTAFLDTGASISLIAEAIVPPTVSKWKHYSGRVNDANGNQIPILGETRVKIVTNEGTFTTDILMFRKSEKVQHEVLIGMNILRYATLDFQQRKLEFSFPSSVQTTETTELLTLTIPSDVKPEQITSKQQHTCTTISRDSLGTDIAVAANRSTPVPWLDTGSNKVINVHTMESISVPANSVIITDVSINKTVKNQDIVLYQAEVKPGVAMPNIVTSIADGKLKILLTNISDAPVILKGGTKLCDADLVTDGGAGDTRRARVCQMQVTENESGVQPPHYSAEGSVPAVLRYAACESVSPTHGDAITDLQASPVRPLHLSDVTCDDASMAQPVLDLLNEYRAACWLPGERLGVYTGEQLEIRLKNRTIINKAPYRIPHAYQGKLNEYIAKLLKEGTITKSKSSYNSPLIIVKRPDGDIRPCIDYRELNKIIEKVNYPLPRVSDLLEQLGQATYMTCLDLASAYHQISLTPESQGYTAFTVGNTKFQFSKVPFGLQNSPGWFSRIINTILYDVLGPQVLAYMDDIILFSKTPEQHLQTLRDVLAKLADANVKLKIHKCKFFAEEIKFLGYVVTKDGMQMSAARVHSIAAMPYPQNKRELQAFLGVCNYFRVFIHQFAQIAEPLYHLLRKNVRFVWTNAQAAATDELKRKLANAPIVKFPDFTKKFHLQTDASNAGIAAVLMQEHDGLLHPVSCMSKTLNTAQRNYSTTKKEALALIFALEQCRHLILNYQVICYTDHKPLLGVLAKPSKDACLQRWALLAQEYDLTLRYLEGKNNIFADALSRLPAPTTKKTEENVTDQLQKSLDDKNEICYKLSEYLPIKMPWGEKKLSKEQQSDPTCMAITARLRNDKLPTDTPVPPHVLRTAQIISGVLYILREVKRTSIRDAHLVPYVPDTLMPDAFQVVHQDSTAGHPGLERTEKLFARNFYNKNAHEYLKELIGKCELCIKAKSIPKAIPISKYPIPMRPFHTVTSDILGPLRMTENGHMYVLTVRDFTTRYTVLSPLKRKDADSIIDALRYVIANYGSSCTLLTDNAAEYTSDKLKNFLKHYNTEKRQIAPYHPASQGLAERINREITKLLRILLTQHNIDDWDLFLPGIQLIINSTYNASIQESPFFALYGYDSATSTLTPPRIDLTEGSDLYRHMQRQKAIRKTVRENLLRNQTTYTTAANKGRKEKPIEVGQRVYAKLNKQLKNHQKLDLPISGPFRVMSRKGKAWNLMHVQSRKKYVVHPDEMVIPLAKRETNQLPEVGEDESESDSDSPVIGPTHMENPPNTNMSTHEEPSPTPPVENATTSNRRTQPHRSCKR